MVKDDNLRIIDTARREEIFVYEALKEIVFKNKITYIGDDIANGLADIFTDDLTIGMEVVTCERRVIHKYTERNKLPIKFSMNIKSKRPVYKSKQEKYSFYKLEQDEFYQNLRTNINKKLRLLKHGNYMGTKEIYLCICSVYEDKPYIDVKKIATIYKEGTEKLKVKFDMVFLLVNNTLYMINNNNEFGLMEEYDYSRIKVDKINK